MFEDIRNNKIKSYGIVFTFILLITLLIYFILQFADMGPLALVIALTFSIVSAWASYYYSDKIILSISHARPATHEEDQKLVNILDTLMLASRFTI